MKNRTTNRILSFALAFTLALGLFAAAPITANAASTLNMGDYLYFGTYDGDPILWRVTDASSGTATLLSEYILEDQVYNNTDPTPPINLSDATFTYESSTLYSYVQNIPTCSWFTTEEPEAIISAALPTNNSFGGAVRTNGSSFNYWLALEPFAVERAGQPSTYLWHVNFVDFGGVMDNGGVLDSFGIRPVLQINLSSAIFTSGFSVPKVTTVSNSDTVGHRAGEARAQNLEISVSGEGAVAGNVLRVKLDDRSGNTITADHALHAGNLTSGAFTNLAVSIPVADFANKPAGSYAVSASLIQLAGSVETTVSTANAANAYPITAAATVPGAPTNVTAAAGNGQAIVSFDAPVSDGGSAIIGYTVTSSPGNITETGASSPITVTGLTNGTAYSFTVTATNGVGPGAASAASNSVTPTAAVTTYTLTVNAGAGGTVTGGGSFAANTSVTVKATPNADYAFNYWTESGMPTAGGGNETNPTYTFLMPGNNVTLTANFKYIGGSGGGGSSSDSGSTYTPPAATIPSTLIVDAPRARAALAAMQPGSTRVGISSINSIKVLAEAWTAFGKTPVNFDTVADGAVQVRVTVPAPEKMTKDMMLSGFVKGSTVDSRKALFEKWFSNKVRIIHLEQQEDRGQPVEIAAKVDLTGMDTKNLVFYAYDKAANSYRRIKKPAYWIDSNGYLHFTTEYAGDIIISEGFLEKK